MKHASNISWAAGGFILTWVQLRWMDDCAKLCNLDRGMSFVLRHLFPPSSRQKRELALERAHPKAALSLSWVHLVGILLRVSFIPSVGDCFSLFLPILRHTYSRRCTPCRTLLKGYNSQNPLMLHASEGFVLSAEAPPHAPAGGRIPQPTTRIPQPGRPARPLSPLRAAVMLVWAMQGFSDFSRVF